MSFVAGAHVFPGGRIDAGDRLVDADAVYGGPEGARRFPHLDAAGELACRVGAVRELVEEAGVLLARRDGEWATTEEAESVRGRVTRDAAFEDVIRGGGWRLALEALVPLAQVVTPVSEPRRFDTHFFLTLLPDGRQARADDAESDELVWLSPAQALVRGMSGDLVLLPPTWVTLMQLASFESVDSLFAWARARVIVRVEPRITSVKGARVLTIPAAGLLPGSSESRAVAELRFSFVDGRGWRPAS